MHHDFSPLWGGGQLGHQESKRLFLEGDSMWNHWEKTWHSQNRFNLFVWDIVLNFWPNMAMISTSEGKWIFLLRNHFRPQHWRFKRKDLWKKISVFFAHTLYTNRFENRVKTHIKKTVNEFLMSCPVVWYIAQPNIWYSTDESLLVGC